MMGPVRQWLLGVTAAALVLALAETLAPEGGAKKVCRLAGGLALLLTAVGPLAGLLEGGFVTQAVEGWKARLQDYELELEEKNDLFYLSIIEDETAAYIVDKAASMGLSCQVRVEAGGSGEWPIPWRVTITGDLDGEAREALTRRIQEDFAIPAERQFYEGPDQYESGDGA